MNARESIKAMMAEQGVSRAELARRMGVPRSSATMLLAANRNLTEASIERIAAALGCTVSVLLERNKNATG